MKKKFITKLILSGAALAASAATLVSTTYAWYVQNTQVTATGVSGAVRDNGASSIYISKDYVLATPNAATWLPTVEFAAGDHINAIKVENNQEVYNDVNKNDNKVYNGALDPVTLTAANGDFVDVNGSTGGDVYFEVASPTGNPQNLGYYELNGGVYSLTGDTTVTQNKKYYTKNSFVGTSAARVIEFNLYVQANVLTTIRPYLLIENTTTTTATSQTAYKQVDLVNSGKVNQGNQFWIDAVQALRMEVIVNKAVIGQTNSWSLVNDNTSNGIYDVLSIAKKSYNVTDGYKPYSPIESKYWLTTDTTIVPGKTYYTQGGTAPDYTYTPGTPSSDPKTEGFYETVSGIITEAQLAKAYKQTSDQSLVAGKTYYTQGGSQPNYTYTKVDNPDVADIATYYEFDTANMGANKYYKDLTGRTPLGTFGERATPILADKMNTTKLSADTAYRFTFRIWLEGTDPACFDSCVKQTFNIGINFDVENA